MNCEDFENNVNDLAREQLLEAGIRAQALVHRDECPACAERLAEESALSFKLRALAADSRSAVVPPLGNAVLDVLRERQASMNRNINRAQPRFRKTTVAATATAAAAALVLLVIALGFLRAGSPPPTAGRPSNSGTQKEPAAKNIEKDSQSVVGIQLIDKPAQNLGSKTSNRRHKSALNRAAVAAKTPTENDRKDLAATSVTVSYSLEVATDFFPVGYVSAPNLGDGGQLVRVELPRSALVAFGVPMNVDRYNEKVKAEVLFGVDGMAHAIRFVQ